MSIAKPFTFTANTYAKASEVNADFDTVYAQVNTNISSIAQNATDIDNLENNKANINGDYSQRFAVADPTTNTDAVNKRSLMSAISNSVDYINGLSITKDGGSPEDTIIVSSGSCYDSTKSAVLSLSDATSKQNDNQGASTTYYVYIIGDARATSIDILISSNSTTPTLPSGYTLYRGIGYYTTDSDGHIDNIAYYGINPLSNKSINSYINAMMPDFSVGISKTKNTNYIAEESGWLLFYSGSFSINSGFLYIDGVKVLGQDGISDAAGGWNFITPVGKGSTYSYDGAYTSLTFYKAKGV